MSDQITDTPVSSEVVTETPATTEVTEPTTAPEPVVEPQSNEDSGLLDISDEDLQAAIDAALASYEQPDAPTSFPTDKKTEPAKLDSEIEALLQQKDSELTEAKQSLQEKTSQVAEIESAWGMLNEALPDLPDILTKIVSGEEDAVPSLYKKDVHTRLQADTVLWPLIEAHIKGEKPDYPGFIRGLAAQKLKSMPKTNEVAPEPAAVEVKKSNNPGDILSSNKKTVSFN